jgi:hypothetical protein
MGVRRKSPSQNNRAGSQRIVIEGSDSVAVLVEDAESIAQRELLHLSTTFGKILSHRCEASMNFIEGLVQF